MAKAVRWFGVLVLAATLTAGCGKDGDKGGGGGSSTKTGDAKAGGGAVTKAKTPKEAIANMSKATQNMDKGQFLAATYLGESGREFAEAMFDSMAAMTAFGKEMEKAYGKDATADLPKDKPALTDEEIDKLEIKEEGDKAIAKDPKSGKPMPLIKKDGAWMVDMTGEIPTGEDRAKALKQAKAVTKAVNEVRAKIGKPGMTKEKIGEELMGAMMAAAMADANAPK
jgi:hypothetical protein